MLLEVFKNCLPERIVVYLNEQKVNTLQRAALLADEFALTHKATFTKHDSSAPDFPQRSEFSQRPNVTPVTRAPVPTLSAKVAKLCFFFNKGDDLVADCATLKSKQQAAVSRPPKGVGLINTVFPTALKEPNECFKPFVFQGFVSLTGTTEDQRPVTVLRDTTCSQSLILDGILPLGVKSACEVSAVVRGIEMGIVPAPLHHIHVQSKLISGFFPVAVRSCVPIEGVDFIMANDIAGGKVYTQCYF